MTGLGKALRKVYSHIWQEIIFYAFCQDTRPISRFFFEKGDGYYCWGWLLLLIFLLEFGQIQNGDYVSFPVTAMRLSGGAWRKEKQSNKDNVGSLLIRNIHDKMVVLKYLLTCTIHGSLALLVNPNGG